MGMTLEDAIQHCIEKADCSNCGNEHRQLADWLMELQERRADKPGKEGKEGGKGDNKLIYVCSPYRGDVERNLAYARVLTKFALNNSYIPITPHLYLTQVLEEDDPEQRKKGMAAGKELLKQCRYILVGSKYGFTEGMLEEIHIAVENGMIELELTKDGKLIEI